MIPIFSIHVIQEKSIEGRNKRNLDITFKQVVEQSEPQKIILPQSAVNFKTVTELKKELKLEKHPFFEGNRPSEKIVDWINNCVLILEEEENLKIDGIIQYYKVLKAFYFYQSDYGIRGQSLGVFYPEPKYWMKGLYYDKKTLPEVKDYILQILHENNIPIRIRSRSVI